MTAISAKNSIKQNWDIALQNDGLVTKGEADQILKAVRKHYVSGSEKDQAQQLLQNVRGKARSLQEAARAAQEAARSGDPRAPQMLAEVEAKSDEQRQNLAIAQDIASSLAREHANQNVLQKIWAWFF